MIELLTTTTMKRRRFLTTMAVTPLLPLIGCRRHKRPVAAVAAPAGSASAVVLDAGQWATLDAACARIIPTDADPGAREAGVVGYIDGQLAHPPVSGFRRMITVGLRQLDFIARRVHRRAFADLSAEQQDQTLTMLQRSKRMGGRYNGVQFLSILVVLTLEGFLADPIYGGNRDRVGWKLIEFTPQQPGPRKPYRGRALAG